MGVYTVTGSFKFLALFKVAKGIVIFCTSIHCSISNESISSFCFSCGHDLRNALSGVGKVKIILVIFPYEKNISSLCQSVEENELDVYVVLGTLRKECHRAVLGSAQNCGKHRR